MRASENRYCSFAPTLVNLVVEVVREKQARRSSGVRRSADPALFRLGVKNTQFDPRLRPRRRDSDPHFYEFIGEGGFVLPDYSFDEHKAAH
jgi:hypothetical protein